MVGKFTCLAVLRKSILLLSALVSIFFCVAQSSIFTSTTVSTTLYGNSASPIEVGMKFRSAQTGYIKGLRFYKQSGNGGTHIGHLWTSSGTLMATATFVNETSSGWQQVLFTSPVAISAGVTYIASNFSAAGNYSINNYYFNSAVVNGSLRGLSNSESGGNGVYKFTSTPSFPTSSYLASNFWVDVLFATDITPPLITSVTPANGATGVNVSFSPTVTFNEPMNAATITSSTIELRNAANSLIASVISYNTSTRTVTINPAVSLSYTSAYKVTIKGGASGVKDASGNIIANDYSWTFTTSADLDPPALTSVSPSNGSLVTSRGVNVSAVFSEALTASSVNSSTFQLRNSSNVLVPATVVYDAATRTATLYPSALLNSFTTYRATLIGGASGIKDSQGNAMATTYTWTFTIFGLFDSTPPVVLTVSPATGSVNMSLSTNISVVFSEAMNASSIKTSTIELRNASNVLVPATVTYNTTTRTATLDPVASLINGMYYIVRVKGGSLGVEDVSGNNLASDFNSYFTTIPIDNISPTVSLVTPVTGTSGVSINPLISAVFSEEMNATTISTATLSLRNTVNNTNVPISVSYNPATRTVVLTPSASLAYSITYAATAKGGTSGIKDVAGNALANDYTWAFITIAAPDVNPPVITGVTPVAASTGVNINTSVNATFSEAMNASTINASSFELRNLANVLVAATVTYDAANKKAVLVPSAPLANSTLYTATIKGGSAGVKDEVGNALASGYTWTFTTGSSIFDPNLLPDFPAYTDQPVEVGVRFSSSVNGYITGLRFYKGVANTGTHTGHLWTNTGTLLGEVVFTQETASGWQQVLFASPIAINAGITYVASYYSSAGIYAYSNNYFTQPRSNGPLTALADGQDGLNGVYKYSSASTFPTESYLSSNYFVDVLFGENTGPDVTGPVALSYSPANNATGISTTITASVVFNELLDAATVNSSTCEIRNGSGVLISSAITYNAATRTISLTPSSPLAYLTAYTVKIKGGASGIKDPAGNVLAADLTWTFTTGETALLAPTEGPGGPILVISTTANPFSRYAVEILRAEGLNEFAASDISAVTATTLANYDVVVLGEMTVSADQATMFTNWVNAGGTLIAFKPSSSLNSLMGLSAATGTLSDKYLLVNTQAGAGAGIVNETIQFHGTANLHTLSGATSLATLYSTSSVATINPAVTTREVGASGGRAIAFTYDLAKSIIYTRQGNPAWAGQKRDGQIDPIRSDDMFFPDWVDFNKIAIPQADEQQRLLANIILQSNLHRKPLPRFWYLPRDLKAAIVMTGDDHAVNGTPDRFNQFLGFGNNTAQDVADWKAVRGSSYIYPATPITNAQAMAFEAQGFEIALHPTTDCQNFTLSSLQNTFTTQLGQFAAAYPGVSAPATNRTHCLAWSDWASTPKVELQNGIRMDVTFYYWPEVWMQNKPGMFTGSGMPMRFADTDGSLIDVYQAPTQMTDETNMNYTNFCNAVLDKAVGPEGYYGVFTANMHTDRPTSNSAADAIIASAQARQIPVISSKQMLNWLDGRNNSSFGNMTWNNNQLTFTVTARSMANNLKAMLPLYSMTGQLMSITRNGSSVPFTTQTIKGMQYAFFAVTSGTSTYVATYNSLLTRVAAPPADTAKSVVQTNEMASPASSARVVKETLPVAANLYVNAMPNPSVGYFNLVIQSNDANPVRVRVLDISGRVVESYEKITSTGILRLGHTWGAGTYVAEVIQGDQRKVVKLIKTN